MNLEEVLGKTLPAEIVNWHLPFFGEAVVLTGAGGFIGSHLATALAASPVDCIVLVEQCEFALYEVHRQLQLIAPLKKVVPVLASYGEDSTMRRVLGLFQPVMVIHAGAYKHVPMVERNPVNAVRNNVLAFNTLLQACIDFGTSMLVVSSDKAVNPTNVMGATKKLVEDLALSADGLCRVVRFGNVMWSSGSVLPLFMEQLKAGRVVTVTDMNVDRYFMTVGQAVSLLLQCAPMYEGIYALNMGEPVKIVHMVESLAAQLGVTDYKIKVVGLRPGEKLHEELTLGRGLTPTKHPEILVATEEKMMYDTSLMVSELGNAVADMDAGTIRSLLQKYVGGYEPMCGIMDDLWLHRNVLNVDLEDCFAPTPEAG